MMSERRLFLNISQSVEGRPWRDRLSDYGRSQAQAMAQRHMLPDLLARIVAGRGVGLEEVEAFLEPRIKDAMPDPSSLTDMDRLVSRLADAIERKETIALFADYDVDGATSAALLSLYLKACGLPSDLYIPDRIFEGYGPNLEALKALKDKGATLLLTLDCGTASHEVFAQAEGLFDILVIDHHQADEVLPPVYALVNPNRMDDLSGLGHLCAAGVAFMVLVALNRALRGRGFFTERPEPDLMALLDLVALGTVADVSPLKGLNRAFVARGLAILKKRERLGLRALMDMARLDGPPTPYHLGFLLGPRINAGGRIGDAALGARLLTTDDEIEAMRIAADLDRLNKERQVVEQAALFEAEQEALASLGMDENALPVVVAAGENWHPGIVGLVAARLKERFKRPAFAITFEGGKGTGSGRSILGVDLGRTVRQAVAEGLLAKGGGHAMAAGVTLAREKLAEFRAFLETRLALDVEKARREDALIIDGATTAGAIRPDMVNMLNRAGPFGSGNPEPVLVLPAHTILYAEEVGQGGHIRLRLKAADGATLDAIAFRAADKPLGRALMQNRGRQVHAAGTLSLDYWQGRERVQFRLLDLAVPEGRV